MPRPPLKSTLFPYTTLFRSTIELIVKGWYDESHEALGSPSDRRHHRRGHLACPVRPGACRSEEHTSELQSRFDLVCRLLLENKREMLLSAAAASLAPGARGR